MLTGQPPFTGPTVESVVRQHMVEEARPVSQLRPAVPPVIADVLTRALAKNPADRFSPAAHFAAALVTPFPLPRSGEGGQRVRAISRTVIGIGIAGILLAVAATFLLARGGARSAVTIGQTTQVTRAAGLEVDPALSPDGENIAYAAGPTTAMQIYVRQVSGGRPVAYAGFTTQGAWGHLDRIAVDPATQGSSFGAAILAHALGLMQRLGVGRVTLSTQNDNYQAHRLYEGFGFQQTSNSQVIVGRWLNGSSE
jgi:ribosomal protein S18 acetylase RimI-like enzyme